MDFVASGKDPETVDETEIHTIEARQLKLKYLVDRLKKNWAEAHIMKHFGF